MTKYKWIAYIIGKSKLYLSNTDENSKYTNS